MTEHVVGQAGSCSNCSRLFLSRWHLAVCVKVEVRQTDFDNMSVATLCH